MQKTIEKEQIINDRLIKITDFASLYDTKSNNKEINYSEFVKELQEPKVTKEKGSAGGFVGGVVEDKRSNSNVQSRSVISIDIDDYPDGMNIKRNIKKNSNYPLVMYSTHNSTKEKPRYRVIIPLKQDIEPGEYELITRYVVNELDVIVDEGSYEFGRFMYYPTCEKLNNYEMYEFNSDKQLFDVDDISLEDLKVIKSIMVITNKGEEQSKKDDPRKKKNVVGAFCEVYDIPLAIKTFLPTIYKHYRANRYSHVSGTTEGGLIVYDGGNHAHSHHSTDVIQGENLNSFDLVREHLFSELDSDVKEGTPIVSYPSYIRMSEFALEDKKVKTVHLSNQKNLPKSEWITKLQMNQKGQIVSNVKNIKTIMDNDLDIKDFIRLNEFTGLTEIYKKPSWRAKDNTRISFTDTDRASLHFYFANKYEINSTRFIDTVLEHSLNEKSYHPIKEYLNGLKWDKTERLESLFIDYLGAEDSAYTRAVTRKILVAAVNRIYRPGVKFDNMLVLVGGQGIGKSFILSKLGKEWFTDSIMDLRNEKDAREQIHSSWIVEFAELSAFNKAEVEKIKAFISATEDKFRKSYARNVEIFQRENVFFGTTNNVEFLKDQTGNRRFWVVNVDKSKRKKNPFKQLSEYVVNQIWAEAVELYGLGETLFLNVEEEAMAKKIQSDHTVDDGLRGIIEKYLEDNNKDKIHAREIWSSCMNHIDEPTQPDITRINNILRTFEGWTSKRTSFGKDGVQRGFIKE